MTPDLWLFQQAPLLFSLDTNSCPRSDTSSITMSGPKGLGPSSCLLKSLKIRRKRSLFLSGLSVCHVFFTPQCKDH